MKEIRRRNLVSFPFFIHSGVQEDLLVFRSLIPSASDPLTCSGASPFSQPPFHTFLARLCPFVALEIYSLANNLGGNKFRLCARAIQREQA